MEPQRLQKVIAQQGLASRREVERWISEGRIKVNGKPAQLGQRVDPQRDRFHLDGEPLQLDRPQELIYILLHKPKGVVSTCKDPEGRRTVLDLLPPALRQGKGIHPVGRLDSDSTGALLLSNDGDLTFYLTHPRHELWKTYRVWVAGYPQEADLEQWRSGLVLTEDSGEPASTTLPAYVEVITQEPGQTCLKFRIREGRNRQIRRMTEQLGYPVQRLHRLAIGDLELGSLYRGQWRSLKPWEVDRLRGRSSPLPKSKPHKPR